MIFNSNRIINEMKKQHEKDIFSTGRFTNYLVIRGHSEVSFLRAVNRNKT